jgi:hypothetical protein
MNTVKALGKLACGSCLTPETVGKPGHSQGKFFPWNNRVGIITAKSDFGGSYKTGVFALKRVNIGLRSPRVKTDTFKDIGAGNVGSDKWSKTFFLQDVQSITDKAKFEIHAFVF